MKRERGDSREVEGCIRENMSGGRKKAREGGGKPRD